MVNVTEGIAELLTRKESLSHDSRPWTASCAGLGRCILDPTFAGAPGSSAGPDGVISALSRAVSPGRGLR